MPLDVRVKNLESRVEELERRLAGPQVAASSAAPIEPLAASPPPVPMPRVIAPRVDAIIAPRVDAIIAPRADALIAPVLPPVVKKTLRERLPDWAVKLIFAGNSLVKVGVLILFLGLAFLLRYTADRVTAPVELRYAGVLLVGMALLALGWLLRHKRRDYAHIMQGAGIAVLYLTVLGAMKLHPLIPLGAGFAALALIAVLAAALAVLQDAFLLALLAALGGFAAPILVSSGGSRPAPLLFYLAFLDIGILLMAWFKSWRTLNVLGFLATFALASSWASRNYQPSDDVVLHLGLGFFFLLFTVVSLLFARRSLLAAPPSEDASLGTQARASLTTVGRVDSALVFGLPMAAFGMEYLLTQSYEFVPAFVALGFSLLYLLIAKAVFVSGSRGLGLLAEAFAVVGVIFATLSIPLGLEGLWTGAAWAVEAAGIYWLGLRQNRPYARMLAFVVMAGAAWKLLQETAIAPASEVSLLTGTSTGPILLAASGMVMWLLNRRAQAARPRESLAQSAAGSASVSPSTWETLLAWEHLAAAYTPWLASYALALLPWQWWQPGTAAAATAVMAVGVFLVGRRWEMSGALKLVTSLQALSVLGVVSTFHLSGGQGNQAALANGWQGAWPVLVMALSLILTTAWRMLAVRTKALAENTAPQWSNASSVAVVVITGLLCAASLFGLGQVQVAWAWPIASLLLLGFSVRLAHPPLAVLAGVLQIVGALCFVFTGDAYLARTQVFINNSFGVPLTLGLVAFISAWMMWRESGQVVAGKLWVSAWTATTLALWLPLAWGLGWWMSAWLAETSYLARALGFGYQSTLHLTVVLATSALLTAVASWRGWLQAGSLTALTLLGLFGCYLAGVATLYPVSEPTFLASAEGGFLLWPMALVWHFVLLRKQAQWLPSQPLRALHLAGFWFFLYLFARESQALVATYLLNPADTSSSWSWLALMAIPVLVLSALRHPWLLSRWPLTEFTSLYRVMACAPVAIYLFAWLLMSNWWSPGHAAPLPYVPLLNPLELGHWLVWLALFLWARDLPQATAKVEFWLYPAAAASAFLLITGAVLRTCHHYAGADWGWDGAMQSAITQAALSVTWAIGAVVAMALSARLGTRTVWLVGAALMGVVVLKLFLVDLSDRGGIYRIVSFIGVGILLLLVGYFAPVPPKTKTAAQPAAS